MRIERFEDIDPPAVWRIEAWQLARELTRKVNERKVTLNPACHPCPQYGRRASGRGEPVNL